MKTTCKSHKIDLDPDDPKPPNFCSNDGDWIGVISNINPFTADFIQDFTGFYTRYFNH
jgi:hypothetical protein